MLRSTSAMPELSNFILDAPKTATCYVGRNADESPSSYGRTVGIVPNKPSKWEN